MALRVHAGTPLLRIVDEVHHFPQPNAQSEVNSNSSEETERRHNTKRLETLVNNCCLLRVCDHTRSLLEPTGRENLEIDGELSSVEGEAGETVEDNEHGAPDDNEEVESTRTING